MRPVETRGGGVTGSLDTNTNHSYYLGQVKQSGSFASCTCAFAMPLQTARSSQPPSEGPHGSRISEKSWACQATVAAAGAAPESYCSKWSKAGDPRTFLSPPPPESLSAIEEYPATKHDQDQRTSATSIAPAWEATLQDPPAFSTDQADRTPTTSLGDDQRVRRRKAAFAPRPRTSGELTSNGVASSAPRRDRETRPTPHQSHPAT
jgi:hypothetical protein